VCLAREWVVGDPIPPIDDLLTRLASGPAPRRIDFDASRLRRWDSLLLTFLVKLIDYCAEHAVEANREGLPQGVQGLLALAYAVPGAKGPGASHSVWDGSPGSATRPSMQAGRSST
jgi:phospholipid/cholesterol/gamma-HCH transport system permease protein